MKSAKILIIAVILALSGTVSYFLFKELMKDDELIEDNNSTSEGQVTDEETEEFKVKLSLEQQGVAVPNETGVVSLKIDTTMHEVPGIDVVLYFEPSYIEVQSIDNGVFESYMVKEIDQDMGKVTISAITSPEDLFQGTGVVANLNVKYLKTGETGLFIEDNDESTNVPLVGGESADLELGTLMVSINEKSEVNEEDLLGRD